MDVIILEDYGDTPFNEKDWIGQGKIFDWNKLPDFVTDAKAQVMKVPNSFISLVKLPQQNMSVSDFLAFKLPQLSAELISTKTDLWFSMEAANTPYEVIVSRTVPSPDFIRRLEATCGQAWLDGAKSVVDHRFNDGKDRLPLWIITYWKSIVEYYEIQGLWKAGEAWLEREEAKLKGKTAPEAIRQARQVVKSLPWNSQMSYCNSMTSTPQLAKFLGTAWLTDEHINLMMEELVMDLKKQAVTTIQIVDLTFTLEISQVYQKLELPESQRKKLWLSRIQDDVMQGKLEKIYFPLHVNSTHWIAGMIDFKRHIFAFGDSLYAIEKGSGAPTKFVKHLQVWLKHGFGKKFKNQGNMLPHAIQPDQYSCPIITANTIAHSIFGRPIWTSTEGVEERIGWFNRCASAQELLSNASLPIAQSQSQPTPRNVDQDDSVGSRRGLSIAELLNPSHMPEMPDYDSDSDSGGSAQGDEIDGGDLTNLNADSQSMLADCESTYEVSSAWESQSALSATSGKGGMQEELPTSAQPPKPSPWSKISFHFLKRARSAGSGSDSDSGSSYTSDSSSGPARKFVKADDSSSKSAVASRTMRQQVKDGAFKINEVKYKKWKQKILAGDPKAEFDDINVQKVRHSVCRSVVTVKEPYDSVRWKEHLQACSETPDAKKGLKSVSLFSMGFTKTAKTSHTTSEATTKATIKVPCPGLTATDNPKIVQYLKRTGALGGGGRSLPNIAKALYNKLFSKLSSKASRKRVVDTQMHEWKWRNDHENLRVFSTSCQKVVDRSKATKRPKPCSHCHAILTDKAFKNAISCPVPSDKNIIFVNHRYCNSLLGKIFARTIGVREIVEAEDAKSSPFVRYAQGALRGDYNNEVFNGLLEAVVTKHDKEERGVHMQNFPYTPAWEEICHIIRTHSPRAYNALREYFPMPSERNIRKKEARQPRFPMDICEAIFELIAEHLKGLDYDGPVGLSCDDTKLFSTFRLYWDSEKNSYFLVGGTDGPLRVADPESVSEVIKQAKAKKATKVRVWCLTIPVPKVSPIIVAALPIDALDATALLGLLRKVLDGLIAKGIRVVSYACDGTEVERSVQRLFLAGTTVKQYKIDNPRSHCPATVVEFGTYSGQVICMVQDSKHALKTLRNNLYSGARLLTFGNFVTLYRHIVDIAQGPSTPLFSRDVVKVDRQDDNAVVRLFSADVLKYLVDHHPEYVGEIVYLFVFGELIDAYQNRYISHLEPIKLVLRARYFLDSWVAFLEKCGYRKDHYFLSREAADILRIIIEGFIALVIIHRDYLPEAAPLLPWLHSSEACEHVFGEARRVVKDFTFLDFIYMIPKLRVKLHQAVVRGKSSDGKARAAGYSHTYFDHEGLDLVTLSTYPSDADIKSIAQVAAQEANSLVSLLGVNASLLHLLQGIQPHIWLLSIDSWVDDGLGELDLDPSSDDSDDESNEAEELQQILDEEERSPISRRKHIDDKCLNLTSVALAITAAESAAVQKFATIDEEEMESVIAEENALAQYALQLSKSLPAVRAPNDPSRPLGHGGLQFDDLDFDVLIEMRRKHQTKQAASGVRTRKTKPQSENETIRGQTIQKFHQALKEAQDERAIGTGADRDLRWRGEPVTGNAANAAVVAASVAKKAAQRRKDIFTKAKVPRLLELIDARVTVFHPLHVGDFGFVLTANGVMLGQVMILTSKSRGKNGKHGDIPESSNIGAVANVGVQLFQYRDIGRQFRSVPDTTAVLQTSHFFLHMSIQFLCLIETKLPNARCSALFVELLQQDIERYKDLKRGEKELAAALKLAKKRAAVEEISEE